MYKIGISGKANSGKNTVSKLIKKQLYNQPARAQNVHCKYIAFADPIKAMVRNMFPDLPEKYLTGSSKFRSEIIPGAFKDSSPLTVRQLLIDIGTEMGRKYKESIWLDAFDAELKRTQSKSFNLIVVADVRFKNEFDHLKNLGFFQIRLLRDKHSVINHSSETSQDSIKDEEFDYVLNNNGTLSDLGAEIAKILPLLKV